MWLQLNNIAMLGTLIIQSASDDGLGFDMDDQNDLDIFARY